MSDQTKDGAGTPNTNDSGSHDVQRNTGYSADYVKELRDEAATWRTKLRESETKFNELDSLIKAKKTTDVVKEEFDKRGIKADPSWVKMEEGKDVSKIVDKFLTDYPQFNDSDQILDTKPKAPDRKPMRAKNPNSNVENTAKGELRSIKEDPIARAKLRDHYRSLLQRESGTSSTIYN